MISTDADAGND